MSTTTLMSPEEREVKLRSIIKSKCRSLSTEHVDHIISKLNVNQRYFIKTTSCPVKFMNIVTSEVIATSSERMLSLAIPILGSFSAGIFRKTDKKRISEAGSIDAKQPAAGVKITLSCKEGICRKTYTLVVFEPSGRL